MSAPASAWTSACSTSSSTVSSLTTLPGLVDQPVMAVRGIGIERDVGQHADLGHRILDRADRAAHQVVGVERLARIVGAQLARACWGTARCTGCRASRASRARAASRSTDQRDTPGSAAIGSSHAVPSETNSGQIDRRVKPVLGEHRADPRARTRPRRMRRAG